MESKNTHVKIVLTVLVALFSCVMSIEACPPPPPPPPSTPPASVANPESSTSPNAPNDPNCTQGKTGGDPVLLGTGELVFSRQDTVIDGRSISFPIVRYYRGKPVQALKNQKNQKEYTDWMYFRWKHYNAGYYVSLVSFSVAPSTGCEVVDSLYFLGMNENEWVGGAVRFELGTGTTYTIRASVCITNSGYSWTRHFSQTITIPQLPNIPSRYLSCLAMESTNEAPRAGWTMSYNMYLIEYPVQERIHLHTGDGNVCVYTLSTDIVPPYGHVWRCPTRQDFLMKWDSGTYTLFGKHNQAWNFDKDGYIAFFRQYNKLIQFCYLPPPNAPVYAPKYGLNDVRRLDYILDDCNRKTRFLYADANDLDMYPGNLSKIVDWTGREWHYEYYTDGDLKSVTDPNGYKETYYYTDDGVLEKVEDHNSQIWMDNDYDSQGRIYSQTWGGVITTFSYGENGVVTEMDPNGVNVVHVLDPNGLALSETVETETGSITTTYQYNDSNDLTKITYPEENGYDLTYYSNGNLWTASRFSSNTQDPGLVYTLTYEDTYDLVKTITNPRSKTTTFTYDHESTSSPPEYPTDYGLLMKITYPQVTTDQGLKTPEVQFTYNVFNQVETVTSPDGIVIKYEYYNDTNEPNKIGLLKKAIIDYGTAPECLNITYECTYDQTGRYVEVKSPENEVTKLTYNVLDLLAQIEDPAGNITKLFYNADRKVEKVQREFGGDWQEFNFGYNIMAKLNTITDALGRTTSVGYDDRYQPKTVTDAKQNATTAKYNTRKLVKELIDAEERSTHFEYNDNGQLRFVTDAKTQETEYTYDGYGRLDKVIYENDSYEQYGYDAASNITSYRNRAGQTITFGYDALNRLERITRPSEADIVLTYNLGGSLVKVAQSTSQITMTHDRIGRVASVTDQNNKAVGYEYDKLGRRTKLVYPDNTYITYHYDAAGRLEYIKDQSGNIIVGYTYDQLSRPIFVDYYSGNWLGGMFCDYEDKVEANDDNLGDRIEAITYSFAASSSHSISYSYDNVGNATAMAVSGSCGWVYDYDKTYQLTDADYNSSRSIDYSYDAVYNRASVTDNSSVTNYSANSVNQYTAVGTAAPTYDANGNITWDGVNVYEYYCDNRLGFAAGGSGFFSYHYDLLGRRIRRLDLVYSEAVEYVWDGEHIIAEYDSEGSLIRKYIYGPGIDNPVAMLNVSGSTETRYYYYTDALGSVRLLTNAAGAVVEGYSYDPFGKPIVNTSAGTDNNWLTPDGNTDTESAYGNRLMFTARDWDATTGIYYYRFRDYSPQLGRFLQPDPLGYIDSLNLYAYCGNNPINFLDPWGLEKDENGNIIPHVVGPALIGLGQPLKAIKPVGKLSSKPGSSIASWALRKAFPQKMGTRVLGTGSLGGALGRAVPYIGWAWLATDLTISFLRLGADTCPPYQEWKQDYIDKYGPHYWPGSGL